MNTATAKRVAADVAAASTADLIAAYRRLTGTDGKGCTQVGTVVAGWTRIAAELDARGITY